MTNKYDSENTSDDAGIEKPSPHGYDGRLRLGGSYNPSPQALPSRERSSIPPREAPQRSEPSQGRGHRNGEKDVDGADSRDSRRKDTPQHAGKSRPRPQEDDTEARRAAIASRPEASKPAKPRKRRGLKVFLVILIVALLGFAGAAYAYMSHINSLITGGVDEDLSLVLATTADSREPFYMLLLGVDHSEGRDEQGESIYRTDTMILARIDPGNKKITLISIHRDSLVDLGEYGQQKINAAYAFGGPSLAVQTVEEYTGIDISHYAEIDFEGLEAVVDSIGGIEVNLPIAISDPGYTDLELPAGRQVVDGETALNICRCRHAYDDYGDGDSYRSANQRMVIQAILRKVMSSDAVTIANTVTALAEHVTCDMTVSELTTLATSFAGINVSEDVYSGMDPTTSEFINGGWYEYLDEEAWAVMRERIEAGLPPYESVSDDPTAGVSGDADVDPFEEENLSHRGEVCVINGTGVSGYATSTCDDLGRTGFVAYPSSVSTYTSERTVVYFNGKDRRELARSIAEKLGTNVEIISNHGDFSPYPAVVVVLGADQVPEEEDYYSDDYYSDDDYYSEDNYYSDYSY